MQFYNIVEVMMQQNQRYATHAQTLSDVTVYQSDFQPQFDRIFPFLRTLKQPIGGAKMYNLHPKALLIHRHKQMKMFESRSAIVHHPGPACFNQSGMHSAPNLRVFSSHVRTDLPVSLWETVSGR